MSSVAPLSKKGIATPKQALDVINMSKRTSTSSGNVFADIGLYEPEEALAKAELARQIAVAIKKKGLTQMSAAKVLGVDQPKISALLNGRLSGFSTERLIKFLNALGRDVEIRVKAARTGVVAHTRVVIVG